MTELNLAQRNNGIKLDTVETTAILTGMVAGMVAGATAGFKAGSLFEGRGVVGKALEIGLKVGGAVIGLVGGSLVGATASEMVHALQKESQDQAKFSPPPDFTAY